MVNNITLYLGINDAIDRCMTNEIKCILIHNDVTGWWIEQPIDGVFSIWNGVMRVGSCNNLEFAKKWVKLS